MIHVYVIPKRRSEGYCFAGPVPISFGNVDWMGTPPSEMDAAKVRDFLQQKRYFESAAPGTQFLVLCTDRPELTFTMER